MLRRKIYGVCLERVDQLMTEAKERLKGNSHQGRVLLESYCTGNIDEIVYILELYPDELTQKGLRNELEKLASYLSRIAHEELTFGYTEEGHLGLYLTVTDGVMDTQEVMGAHG